MIKSIQVQVNKRPQSHSAAVRSSSANASMSPKHSPRRPFFADDGLALNGQAVEYPVVVISPRHHEFSPPVSARHKAPRPHPSRQISEQLSLNSIDQSPSHGFPVEESPRFPGEGSLPGSSRSNQPHYLPAVVDYVEPVTEAQTSQQQAGIAGDHMPTYPEELHFNDPAHLNETRLAAMLSRQRAKESIYNHGNNNKAPQPPNNNNNNNNNNQQEQRTKKTAERQRPQSAPRRYYLDPNEVKADQQAVLGAAVALEDGLVSKPIELAGRQSRAASAKASNRPKSRTGQRGNRKSFDNESSAITGELQLHSATSATNESPRDTDSLQKLLYDSLQEYYTKHEASMIHGDTSTILPEVYPRGDAVGGSFNVNHTKAGPWPSNPPQPVKHLNLADMVKEMLATSIEECEGIPVRPSRPKSSLGVNKNRGFGSANATKRPHSAAVTKSKLQQSFQNNHLQPISDPLHYLVTETNSDYVFGSFASSQVVETPLVRQNDVMSPGMAVMLLAHDILQKQPKPRFPKANTSKDQNVPINIMMPTNHLQKVVNKVNNAEQRNPTVPPSSSQHNPLSLPDDLKQQMDKQLKMYKHLTFGEQLSVQERMQKMIKPIYQAPPQSDATQTAMFSPRTAFAIQHAMTVVEGNTTAEGEIKPEFHQRLSQLQDRYRKQLLPDDGHFSIDASQSLDEDIVKDLPPQSPNSAYTKEEIEEITLRWKKFLSHPNHPPRTSTVTYQDNVTKKSLISEPPTVFYNTETSMIENSAPNTARTHVQPSDSLLPPSTDIGHNPYAIDNYDPQHLLYSPELLYNAYIEHGGLLNTANYRHPSSIPNSNPPPQSSLPAPTPDGRPISRGNYLYSFYEDQQQKLKKQYQTNKNQINQEAGPESHVKLVEEMAPSKGKVTLTFNSEDKAALRSESPPPESPKNKRPSSPLAKSKSKNDLNSRGQNEVVRINHHVPSLRIPISKLPTQQDHRYGSAIAISYDEQEANQVNRTDFSDSYLSLESNGALPIIVDPATNKEVPLPGSPTNAAGIKRSQSKQTLEDIMLQPNQISFHDKKASHPAHTTRQSAVRYAKYVDERNKELNKVGWNNNKLKDPSKLTSALPLVLDVHAPPPPVLNLAYNSLPTTEFAIPQLGSAANSRPGSKPGSRPSSANSTKRRQ